MFKSRKPRRLHRFDAAASRVGRPNWRRLAIEPMESRLMLSGTDLDTSTFNLDFLGPDYAIISTSNVGSPVATLTDSVDRVPDILVSATPGYLISVSHHVLSFDGAGDLVSNDSFDRDGIAGSGLFDAPGIAAGWLSDQPSTFDGLRTTGILPALPTIGIDAIGIDAIGKTDVQVNIGPVVDNLLTPGARILDQSVPADAAVFALPRITGSTGVTHPIIFLNSPPAANDPLVVSAGDVAAEGGMVPIERIVGELAGETIVAAAGGEQLAPSRAATEITGELTRVAVMELIQGETDPAGPPTTADRTIMLATNDAVVLPPNAETRRGTEQIASRWLVEALAGQTGAAVSLLAPEHPVYTAAMANTANATNVAIAAVVSAPISGPARSEAFSQWGDEEPDEPRATAYSPPNYWLDATPILLALACERVLAAKKKRQQREPAVQPSRPGCR